MVKHLLGRVYLALGLFEVEETLHSLKRYVVLCLFRVHQVYAESFAQKLLLLLVAKNGLNPWVLHEPLLGFLLVVTAHLLSFFPRIVQSCKPVDYIIYLLLLLCFDVMLYGTADNRYKHTKQAGSNLLAKAHTL